VLIIQLHAHVFCFFVYQHGDRWAYDCWSDFNR